MAKTNEALINEGNATNLHFQQTIGAVIELMRNKIEAPPYKEIKHLLVDLPPSMHKKTMVFDLDETLIHCVDDLESENPQIVIDLTFKGEPYPIKAGINIRPGVRECLEYANTMFRVIVFTASEREYANPILDYLDPEKKLI